MDLAFQKIGITARSDIADQTSAVDRIIQIVTDLGAEVFLDAKRCSGEKYPSFSCLDIDGKLDLMIVIGGDGTILRTVREMQTLDTPILAINKGTVGFLTSMTMDEAPDVLPSILHGTEEMTIEKRSILNIDVCRKHKVVWNGKALNEAVVSQGAIARLVDLEARVNDRELTTFHADGIIIATPTGSTAYSLAAGGPIVHPQLPAMIVTPINPHSFSQKPIVLPSDTTVTVSIVPKRKKFDDIHISLTLDGQIYHTLESDDVVRATMPQLTVKFLHRRCDTFYGTLRDKLKWGDRNE